MFWRVLVAIDFHSFFFFFFLLWKSMATNNCLVTKISKYLLLCSTEERNSYRFETTWQKFHFGWTIPLNVDSDKHRRSCTCWHMSWLEEFACHHKNVNICSYHEKHQLYQTKSISTPILYCSFTSPCTQTQLSRDSIRGRRWTTPGKWIREIITQNIAVTPEPEEGRIQMQSDHLNNNNDNNIN